MTKKEKKQKQPRRESIALKIDRAVLDAARLQFAKAGLDVATAIRLFVSHAAERQVEDSCPDDAHKPFSTVDDLMEYLEERGERTDRVRFKTTLATGTEKAPGPAPAASS